MSDETGSSTPSAAEAGAGARASAGRRVGAGRRAGTKLRLRAAPAAAAVVTVAAGLSVRSVLDGDPAKYAGDALYALLMFWLVLVVAPRARGAVAAAVAFGISAAIELFQLTGIPAELGAHSTLARLVLGTTFNVPDLPFYAVGAVVGWLAHRAAVRARVEG